MVAQLEGVDGGLAARGFCDYSISFQNPSSVDVPRSDISPSDSFRCERIVSATKYLSTTSTEGQEKCAYNFYRGGSFTDVSFP